MNHCFHCDQPALARFCSTLGNKERFFCCAGCQAVAEMIFAQGLESYYQHRSVSARQFDVIPPQLNDELFQSHIQTDASGKTQSVTLFIEELTCPACSWLIERRLRQDKNVRTVSTNLSARRTFIEWNADSTTLAELLQRLHSIGYHASPYTQNSVENALENENLTLLKRMTVAAFGMMQAMMYTFGLYFGLITDLSSHDANWLRWAGLFCTLPVVLYSALPFYKNAWRALRLKSVNMDVPVSLGILAAFVVSSMNTWQSRGTVYFDSIAMFAFLLLTSRYIETRLRDAANKASTLQQRLLPTQVNCYRENQWQLVALKSVHTGEIIRVTSGEIIAIDGEIIAGQGSVDERIVSGESMPVFKTSGSNVLAGCMVQGGTLDIRVSAEGKQTYLARLSQLHDQALAERPTWQLLADRIAHYFVLAVLVIASGSYFYWRAIDEARAFDVLLAVLVVTCPCALSLALPTAWAAATKRLLQQGFLIRRAQTLAALTRVDTVIIDKTGTLTTGQFDIENVQLHSDVSKEKCLQIAAALEQHSRHPIAKAFTPFNHAAVIANQVSEKSGVGLEGYIDGRYYFIGRREGLDKSCIVEHDHAQFYLADNERLLASFTLRDQLRVESLRFVQQLRALDLSIIIASGDREFNVASCAKQLDITRFHARLMPEQKLAVVRSLQQQGHVVLMIGDGINDTPVLAGADASIAVGDGVDFARRAADAVLINPSLLIIINALKLSHQTRRIIRQNIVWAVLYNLLALPSAITGVVSPWEAALGMSLSSLLVTLNSMRLQANVERIKVPELTKPTMESAT